MSERETPIPVSVTMPKTLIEQIDARATAQDLTRSQYFRRLAREDIERSQKLVQQELPSEVHA